MSASALLAALLSCGDTETACPGFRTEWQITPAGQIRINFPPAAPWPDPLPEPEQPSREDLLSAVAEQYGDRDRDDERGAA